METAAGPQAPDESKEENPVLVTTAAAAELPSETTNNNEDVTEDAEAAADADAAQDQVAPLASSKKREDAEAAADGEAAQDEVAPLASSKKRKRRGKKQRGSRHGAKHRRGLHHHRPKKSSADAHRDTVTMTTSAFLSTAARQRFAEHFSHNRVGKQTLNSSDQISAPLY